MRNGRVVRCRQTRPNYAGIFDDRANAAQEKFTEHQSIQSLVETSNEANLGGSLGDNVSNVVGVIENNT